MFNMKNEKTAVTDTTAQTGGEAASAPLAFWKRVVNGFGALVGIPDVFPEPRHAGIGEAQAAPTAETDGDRDPDGGVGRKADADAEEELCDGLCAQGFFLKYVNDPENDPTSPYYVDENGERPNAPDDWDGDDPADQDDQDDTEASDDSDDPDCDR